MIFVQIRLDNSHNYGYNYYATVTEKNTKGTFKMRLKTLICLFFSFWLTAGSLFGFGSAAATAYGRAAGPEPEYAYELQIRKLQNEIRHIKYKIPANPSPSRYDRELKTLRIIKARRLKRLRRITGGADATGKASEDIYLKKLAMQEKKLVRLRRAALEIEKREKLIEYFKAEQAKTALKPRNNACF